MESSIYEIVGRFVFASIRIRYRTQIRIAAGAAIGAILLGGFLAAKREPPEG